MEVLLLPQQFGDQTQAPGQWQGCGRPKPVQPAAVDYVATPPSLPGMSRQFGSPRGSPGKLKAQPVCSTRAATTSQTDRYSRRAPSGIPARPFRPRGTDEPNNPRLRAGNWKYPMDVKTQAIEQYLFEQLEKVAPGKYTLASVLQRFKSQLRFPCSHLKGGGRRSSLTGLSKDYNLSIFTFPTGVTEIKCLYNCGLKIRSDEKDLVGAFSELYDFPTTNHRAASEQVITMKGGKRVPVDPGPAPTYSDEYRQRIKNSTEVLWKAIEEGLECGRIKPGDKILGGNFPHPDPVEAPDSIIERGIKFRFARMKSKPPVTQATTIVQDSIPEPVKKVSKRKKTQSRRPRSGK